jgi:hypothetical protein
MIGSLYETIIPNLDRPDHKVSERNESKFVKLIESGSANLVHK